MAYESQEMEGEGGGGEDPKSSLYKLMAVLFPSRVVFQDHSCISIAQGLCLFE